VNYEYFRSADRLNRTKIGLKCRCVRHIRRDEDSLNRTKIGLKCIRARSFAPTLRRLNRTKIGLKFRPERGPQVRI